MKETEIRNLQTERNAQREIEEGGGRERNEFKPRAWSLESERERMQGDDIVVFVPFYKFTVKLLIGLS